MAGSMFACPPHQDCPPLRCLSICLAKAVGGPRGLLVFLGSVPFRRYRAWAGIQHNWDEVLKTWYEEWSPRSSEKGFGQRDDQNWSWVNQSITRHASPDAAVNTTRLIPPPSQSAP